MTSSHTVSSTGNLKAEDEIFSVQNIFLSRWWPGVSCQPAGQGPAPPDTRPGQARPGRDTLLQYLLSSHLITPSLPVSVIVRVVSGVGGGGGDVGDVGDVGGGGGGGGSGRTILRCVRRLVAVSVLVPSTDSRAPAPALSAVQCEQQSG